MASVGAQPAAGGTAGDEPTTSGPVGCKGPISSAVAVAVGVATLLILVASVAFGALHRGDETGQVLDFRDVRRSNLGGRGPDLGAPELVYSSVLWGAEGPEGEVDLAGVPRVVDVLESWVVQASHGYQAQAARDNGLEGHLGRISLQPSREAHFNFSFRAAGGGAGGARTQGTQVQRFFFTVFLTSSGELVRVSNFSRLCWDIDAKFERHRRHSGQDVLLLAPPRMEALTPKDLRGLEERRHAATFFFESAESFSAAAPADRGKVTSGMSVEVVRGAYSGFRGTARLSGKQLKIVLANGTALEVEPADCNIIREDLHAIREEWRDEKSLGSSTCAGLYDAELACSQDGLPLERVPPADSYDDADDDDDGYDDGIDADDDHDDVEVDDDDDGSDHDHCHNEVHGDDASHDDDNGDDDGVEVNGDDERDDDDCDDGDDDDDVNSIKADDDDGVGGDNMGEEDDSACVNHYGDENYDDDGDGEVIYDSIAAGMGDCTSSTRAYARVRSSTLEYARVRSSTLEYA
eukprot:s5478_g1.t1